MSRTILAILIIVGVYAAATGASYALFSQGIVPGTVTPPAPPPAKTTEGTVQFDQSLPKTQPCPLNGALYSKQQEAWWQQHRPLGVMIENHENARPQSGISFADVTYEAVAEGGITRTLNVFYCQDGGQIGPVRSARTYFLDYISEYGDHPLYTHVGGANTSGPADALSQINDYGWGNYNDLNQFSIGFPVFWRDYNRLGHATATEHTMYSKTQLLWDFAKNDRGLSSNDKEGTSWNEGFTPYTFVDDAASSERPTHQAISIPFWGDEAYVVDWTYDPKTNLYSRNNGGVPHIDKDTGKQLTAKDIIVLFEKEKHANDGYEDNAHMLYGTTGKGQALVFMNGKEIKATWRKDSRTDRTILTDASGNQISFVRGKLWFEILPTDNDVTVK